MSQNQDNLPGLNILCIGKQTPFNSASVPLMSQNMKDGGGARGLSSLVVLKAFMESIQEIETSDEPPLPADYFDYIAGSGTGG
jgi:patatin-like phospholipase/acyl hydrolase